MKILVCGGAGYIGSHMVKLLHKLGHEIIIFDNFSTGHRQSIEGKHLFEGDLLNFHEIDAAMENQRIDLVMHFCAKAQVSESVSDPYTYYDNNVVGTLNLLKAMRKNDVNKIIFSSSCAIFGTPKTERLSESHEKTPLSPYGKSKLICEQMLEDANRAHGLDSVSLRYFNAAGASPDGDIGESHSPETHLIPNAIRSVLGDGEPLRVYGTDYPTVDGTCVRDYIHVDDLAAAHYLAMNYLNSNSGAHHFNLGSEKGASVLDVINSVSRVSGKVLNYIIDQRREGDPPSLIADSDLAKNVLGWNPKYKNLDEIVQTAWQWHTSQKY